MFQWQAQRGCTMPDLQGRECVDVDIAVRGLYRTANLKVSLTGISRMNSSLQANFCCPTLPRFLSTPGDLRQVQLIWRSDGLDFECD